MSNFTTKQLDVIFSKSRPIKRLDPKEWGLDASRAIIRRSSYGREDEFFGWEVDHIVPESLLKKNGVPKELIDDERNLRPLNWNNNNSKGDAYPKYDTVIMSEDEGESNVMKKGSRTVNKNKQEILRALYRDYIEL